MVFFLFFAISDIQLKLVYGWHGNFPANDFRPSDIYFRSDSDAPESLLVK